ncbi:hypothetical protein SFRURICE_002594 [Spodoptera frugiperda]|nr:hypothetical protein SFRURICE_002594 [Spodoptera frugiperda]
MESCQRSRNKKSEVNNLTISNYLSVLEQSSLINEIEVHGVPEQNAENLTHILLTMSQKLNVDLQETDIDVISRAGPKPKPGTDSAKLRPIVVKLTRKAEWLLNSKA